MAQKVQVTHVSDLDGGPAEETVRFGLDGTEYEIDLSGDQAREMREALGRFTAKARKKQGPRKPRSRKPSRDDLPSIREYARARGYKVGTNGRVSRQITMEYDLLAGKSAAPAV